MKILDVKAMEGMDSRGMPTVMATVLTEKGCFRGVVPSGASVGKYEAHELRDGGGRLRGRGVKKAVGNVNTVIREKLRGREIRNLSEADALLLSMNHTENKSIMGANAMLAVSMACARAFAADKGEELFWLFGERPVLPCPMMNILNGGAHAANNVDLQEFMILPVGARDFPEAMDMGREVYFCLKDLLKSENHATGAGDEGGFAPNLRNDEQALEYIMAAVTKAGLSEKEILLALDAAASEWYAEGIYRQPKSGKEYTGEALIEYYRGLVRDYPIVSIEDGMGEEDAEGFRRLKDALSIRMVGDDLFVTNPRRIKKYADCATDVLIKPNQIGTVTETLAAMAEARAAGCGCILSHRSGDTEDTFIADMAAGTACGLIKTGAPARGERTAKYNRLLEIHGILGETAVFAGKNAVKMQKNA